MKKTKVLIDIFYYKTALSGIKTYIEEILLAAKDHGSNDIDYIFSHDISKMVNNQFFINSKYRLVRWIFQFRYFLWKQLFLPILLLRKKVDYVICPDYVAPILCSSKKIVVIHDNLFWKYPQNYSKLWRKYFTWLIKAGIDKKTKIVTTSKYSRNGLSNIFKDIKIKSIYQSSNTNCSGIKKSKKKYITHIGTFEKRKDLMTLVKAFKKLIENEYLNYKLVLAGAKNLNGYDRLYFEIKNYIQNNNLSDYIETPGYLKVKDIKKLYSESLIYVFPSLDEGFGIPIIESMKSDVPIICSDIEIFKEIGKDSALYFKAGNHNDLYKKLNILINDDDLRKNLVKLGKKNVKRFNRSNFIKEFEKIYN